MDLLLKEIRQSLLWLLAFVPLLFATLALRRRC